MEPVAQVALTNVDVAVASQRAAATADIADVRSALVSFSARRRPSDSVITQSIALPTRTVANRG